MVVASDTALKRVFAALCVTSKVTFDLAGIRLVGRVDHPSPSGCQHLHTHTGRGHLHLSIGIAFV